MILGIFKILHQLALGVWGILPGNYSGITHVDGNLYAVVDDKCDVDGFRFLTLDIDSVSGKLLNASMTEPQGMTQRREEGRGEVHDCEGIAYCRSSNSIFVSREDDQRVVEYTLDGVPTGRELFIPPSMGKGEIMSNLGFEALTYNERQQRFWTTTESTLPADGECSSAQHPEVQNHLRLVAFDASLRPTGSYVYTMDRPKVSDKRASLAHGVPSLLALDDGSIIVMEREACIKRGKLGSYVSVKLYRVCPSQDLIVPLEKPMSEVTSEQQLKKELVGSFTTRLRIGQMNFANYEGMCLGPQLTDGRQTLILIADSQAGAGNSLFHLKDKICIIAI